MPIDLKFPTDPVLLAQVGFEVLARRLGFGLWEQLGENCLFMDFRVSGGDAAFKH